MGFCDEYEIKTLLNFFHFLKNSDLIWKATPYLDVPIVFPETKIKNESYPVRRIKSVAINIAYYKKSFVKSDKSLCFHFGIEKMFSE